MSGFNAKGERECDAALRRDIGEYLAHATVQNTRGIAFGVEHIKEEEAVRPPVHSAWLSSDGADVVYTDDVRLAKAREPMHRVLPTSDAAASDGATCEGGGPTTR